MTNFNLGAALASYKENSEITLLEAGQTFTLECTSATAGMAAKGPTITPVFKVYAGPLTGKRVMVGKISFAEGALFRTIPQLKAFGIDENFLAMANSQPDSVKTVADAMVGRVVDIKVAVEPWQGEDRNKIVSVRPSDAVSSAPSLPSAPSAPAPAPVNTTVSPQQSSGDRAPTF